MTMELLTIKELMSPPWRLTAGFIRRHRADLGGKGKPLRYPREIVEAYLDRHFLGEHRRAEADEAARQLIRDEIKSVINARAGARPGGRILGRGGRKAEHV